MSHRAAGVKLARAASKPKDSSRLLFQGKVFSVRRHAVVEPGGVRATRDVVHHPGSAVILPLLPDRRIVLIRQYRLSVGRRIWELPAGTIDPGETAVQTARRELAEETGYTSKSWRKLLEFYPTPGIAREKMTLFLARDVRPGPAHMESDERIVTRAFSLPETLTMIGKKQIVDAKTLVGLLYFAGSENEATRELAGMVP